MTSRVLTAGLALAVLGLLLTGCFEENIPERNLDGQVVIPGDLVDDPRELGVVYLGIYEGFDPDQLNYPYPTTGPRVGDAPIGDALPYGGTSVGEFVYGCYRLTRCQIVTGRYATLDDALEVHPVENVDGEAVDPDEMFDQCTWYYGWNSLDEFSFVGPNRLDFSQDEAGDWVADFRAWHTRVPEGALIWGFVDNDHTSCTIDRGAVNRRRSEDGVFFYEGAHFQDVLNYPDKYITDGDLVSSVPTVLEADRLDGYRLVVDQVME